LNGWSDILDKLDGSAADFVIMAFVILLALYVVVRDRHCKEQLEKLEKRMDSRFASVNNRHTEAIDKVWSAIDKLRESIGKVKDLYHQIDKLTSNIAIAIQRVTGLKLIKQSADGKGDHALNRDVE